MDPRAEEVQALLWRTEALKRLGAGRKAQQALAEMARLHEELAFDRLGRGDPDGWIDLYAAVSAFGEAGERLQAQRCMLRARELASQLLDRDVREGVTRELDAHTHWLNELRVLPGLAELARPIASPPPLDA